MYYRKQEGKKEMRIFGLIIVVIMLAIVNYCDYAYAEIALYPLTKTIQIAPGKSEDIIYEIANKGNDTIEVSVSARNWFVLPENKEIEISDWLNLGVDKVSLSKGETKKLQFKITVPKQAKGELAAMISFKPKASEEATLVTSYGVSLYIFIKGTENIKVDIGNILLEKSEGKNYATVEVFNKGNVHVRPHVKVLIEGKKSFKKEIEMPYGKPIFGGQSYTFAVENKDLALKKGNYKITAFVNYGNEKNIVTKTKRISINNDAK